MCPGVMNDKIVANLNLWQHSVHCKFVIIFAERACDIILMVTGRRLLAKHCDVMIGTVHRRSHQIDSAGINTNILLMGMFLMNGRCYQAAVRSHHITSQFCINRYISHTCRYKHLFINLANAFANHANIVRLLFRIVGNSDSAG